MPINHESWSCKDCHKRYSFYDEARQCEIDHITAASVARVSQAIRDSFEQSRTMKAKLRRD